MITAAREIAKILVEEFSTFTGGGRLFHVKGILLHRNGAHEVLYCNGETEALFHHGLELCSTLSFFRKAKRQKEFTLKIPLSETEEITLLFTAGSESIFVRPYPQIPPPLEKLGKLEELEEKVKELWYRGGILLVAAPPFEGKTTAVFSAAKDVAARMGSKVVCVQEKAIFHCNSTILQQTPEMFEKTVDRDVGVAVIDLNRAVKAIELSIKAAESGWGVVLTIRASTDVDALRYFTQFGSNDLLLNLLFLSFAPRRFPPELGVNKVISSPTLADLEIEEARNGKIITLLGGTR